MFLHLRCLKTANIIGIAWELTAEMADAPHLDDVMNKFPVVGILQDVPVVW
jgi:predicted heme/steroid binding protein